MRLVFAFRNLQPRQRMTKDDPRQSAREAGLRYVNDEYMAGITRHGAAGHFYYTAPSGKRVKDAATLARIRTLAIPPAWTRGVDRAFRQRASGRHGA